MEARLSSLWRSIRVGGETVTAAVGKPAPRSLTYPEPGRAVLGH